MKKYYEILGLNEDATLEEVNDSFTRLSAQLYNARKNGEISRADYATRFDELEAARDMIVSAAKKEAEEAALVAEIEKNVKKEVERTEKEAKEAEEKKAGEKTGSKEATETKTVVKQSKVEKETGAKKSGLGWKIAAVVLAGLLIIGAVKGCQDSKKDRSTGAYVTGRPAITETIDETKNGQEELTTSSSSSTETPETSETPGATETQETETQEDYSNREYVVDYGDVMDDTLVMARATEIADQLYAAGIVNPRTTVPWDAEYIFQLIKYANGVYVPETMEEIDILHLDLLNLVMAPLEQEYYGNHIGYVNGADQLAEFLTTAPAEFEFGTAFAEYGQNGVYPLVQWLQQKRYEIYRATDRETILAIYNEVGQVMADLMKGDGCTITVYDGKDAKEGITYHFTSEQVLANHSSALLVTSEAQMILANKWFRTLEDGSVDVAPSYWEVAKKSMPADWRDKVSLDEIIIWINNGCEEQAIDQVLPGGQTFGQRIQGDLEGMALNNYAMAHEGKTLGK